MMGQKGHGRFLGLALFGVVSFVSTVSAEVRYTVTDLGALGWGCFAQDINNQGQIVGTIGTPDGRQQTAFLWENGVMTELGLTWSSAYAINENGQIAGVTITEDGYRQAILWGGGGVTYLGTLGGSNSWSVGMNNLGRVVGVSYLSNDDLYRQAFLWSKGEIQHLEAFDGETVAADINDSGLIIGHSTSLSGEDFAVVWEDGVMGILETDSGMFSLAESVNQLGQIVGWQQSIDNSNSGQACLWQDGIRYDLASLANFDISGARDINNLGQIVGFSSSVSLEISRAVLWDNGNIFDLNTLIDDSLGWELWGAKAINDHGQIIGEGYLNGERHAFLLTPVPEPMTLAMLALGGLTVLNRYRS